MAQVLLIEDDEMLAQSLVRFLTDDGHAVDHAPDLASADALLDPARHQLVLSDNQLPDGLGQDWIGDVKAAHPHLVCVLQSGAFSDREARQLQADLGLDACFAKGLRALRSIEAVLAEME